MTNTQTYHITHEVRAKNMQEALERSGKVLQVMLCEEDETLQDTQIGFKG